MNNNSSSDDDDDEGKKKWVNKRGKKVKQNKYHTESIFLPKPCISLIYGARYDRKIARMAYFYTTHTQKILTNTHTHTLYLSLVTLTLVRWQTFASASLLQHSFCKMKWWTFVHTAQLSKHKIAGIETQPEHSKYNTQNDAKPNARGIFQKHSHTKTKTFIHNRVSF